MSPRHSARHRRQVSPGRRLFFTLTALLAGLVGLTGTVLVGAQFAQPERPTASPTVSNPAMLSRNGSSAQADREEPVSRSIARGASAGPSSSRPAPSSGPTTSARSTPKASPTRTAATRPAPPNTTAPASVNPNTGYLQQVLDLTNVERAKAGCPALQMDSRLQQAAQGHSQDMADGDYFSHNDPDGTTPWDRAEAAGYPNPSGENIAMGYPTPAKVMEAWMNSPGHRANILNCDSHELGVGYVVDDEDGAIWTQLFGFG